MWLPGNQLGTAGLFRWHLLMASSRVVVLGGAGVGGREEKEMYAREISEVEGTGQYFIQTRRLNLTSGLEGDTSLAFLISRSTNVTLF